MSKLTDEQIAGVCYAANSLLQDALGDSHVPAPWHVLTPAQRAPYIHGVQVASYLTAREQHEEWVKYREERGWTYGSVVDEDKKTHPCLVPWELLDDGQRLKDHLFKSIVEALS